jgi:hypothetical protein
MSKLSVVTLELNSLNSHKVPLAAPRRCLSSSSEVKVTASRRQENQSDLEPGLEHFIQILAAQLVEDLPL